MPPVLAFLETPLVVIKNSNLEDKDRDEE